MTRCKEDFQRQPHEFSESEPRLHDIRKVLTDDLERTFSRHYWIIKLDIWADFAFKIVSLFVILVLVATVIALVFLIGFGLARLGTGIFVPSLLGLATVLLVLIASRVWGGRPPPLP